MTPRLNKIGTINRLIILCGAPVLMAIALFAGIANGTQNQISDKYSLDVDPAAKQQLGEQTYDEVMTFFHTAEKAIQTKDVKAIMALYSESYSNGDHNKQSAEYIWQRIFATFDTVAMAHNIKLAKTSAEKNLIVFQCTGILVGVPDENKAPVTIDNWANQEHILVKEAGKWKLMGTYGQERKRLWFDKPMHPLF